MKPKVTCPYCEVFNFNVLDHKIKDGEEKRVKCVHCSKLFYLSVTVEPTYEAHKSSAVRRLREIKKHG